MIPTSDQMSLSWWVARVSPSIIASGVLGVAILHTGFGVPWRRAYVPAIIFMTTYALFSIGMFWVRKQFDRSRDLRLGVCISGIYTLVTVLVGMWYAGDLGITRSVTFTENWIPFAVFMLICTVISFVLVSYWKPFSKPR